MKLPKFLAPFKTELEELHRKEYTLFRGLLDDVRDRMEDGTAPKCWERDFLERQAELSLSDDQGAYGMWIVIKLEARTNGSISCRNDVRSWLRNDISSYDVLHAGDGIASAMVPEAPRRS